MNTITTQPQAIIAQPKKTRTRETPLCSIGLVNILAPKSSPYYRLTWINPDGEQMDTTAGRELEGAKTKAAGIDANLQRAMGPKALTPLGEIVEEYVNATNNRRKGGKRSTPWSKSYRKFVTRNLKRATRGFTHRRALEVDRRMLDAMRGQAGTENMVKTNTQLLRGLLEWGNSATYFSVEQAESLPPGCLYIHPKLAGTTAPSRRRAGRRVNETEIAIRDEDAPSAKLVIAAGEGLNEFFPDWGRLALEVACDAGPRWGEQFQLTAYDITPTVKNAHIAINWQIDSTASIKQGDSRRKLPKGEKTRKTAVSKVSFTGYPLRDRLLARREQALQEQAAGTNPEALMFPTVTGKMHHHSAFMSRYFHPVAVAAGWPTESWTEVRDHWDKDAEQYVSFTGERVQFQMTWHSMRHRFARTCIDVRGFKAKNLMYSGGWESLTVVQDRYYSVDTEDESETLDMF